MKKTLALMTAVLVAACGETSSATPTGTGTNPNAGEPNDTVAKATALALGSPVAASMGSADDEDWYQITIPAAGATVRVQTSQADGTACPKGGLVDTSVWVLDAVGNTLADVDDAPDGTSLCEDFTVALEGGANYVRVYNMGVSQSYPWSYRLLVKLQ